MISVLVIVPTLNSYKLLPGLVSSLRDQTLNCWRVVFIDGASGSFHQEWLDLLCKEDSRFQWEPQGEDERGIFGAMNQGFRLARPNEWVLFWGSDDRAASSTVMEKASHEITKMLETGCQPDLYVCAGRYFSIDNTGYNDKTTYTRQSRFLWFGSLRKSLLWGSTPPHQATLFGPAARNKISSYALGFRLAADLDYFLRLSSHSNVDVVVDNYDLVFMGDSGVSASNNKRRFYEVYMAYRRTFGIRWFFPFVMRYLQRIQSILFLK
jgi:glycosyltransferase involved in cell wall biosynthesis